MKRCPECKRDYYDETLLYCLDDGNALLEGPASANKGMTSIVSEPGSNAPSIPVSESPTRAQINTSHDTAILYTGAGADPMQNASRSKFNRLVIVGTFFLLTIGGIGFAVYKFGWPGTTGPLPAPFQAIKIEPLTSNGKATDAVISPDGRQVVYALNDGGKRSLWLRQVATLTDMQLREPDSKVVYRSLTISRDGDFLYYVDDGTSLRNRSLYQMPLVGGSPTKIVDDIGTPIGLSPDGKQMAYVRSRENESVMIIANADGTGEREIAKRPGNRSFGSLFAGGIAWSKDAKKIISVSDTRDAGGRFHSLVEVTIEDGSERVITPHRWHEINRLVILADGDGLVLTAAEKASENQSKQVWYLPYPGGEPRKITNDLNHYTDLSLNADSGALVTVQENINTDIWVAPDGDSERATQLSSVSGKLDGWDSVAWTPDGKIVYTSVAGGGNDGIWIMDGDGRNRKRLTSAETVAYWPSVTPDGRFIFYNVELGRNRSVWRMDINGGNQTKMFAGSGPKTAAGFLYYGAGGIRKVAIDGGEPVQITEGGGTERCAISADGKLFACQFDPPDDAPQAAIRVISAETGVAVKDFDIKLDLPARIRWSPGGRSITYVSRVDGLNDIWSQPVDGGQPKRITNFKTDQIFSFDWSRDNKLVLSHGSENSDVVLIRNIKQ